MDEEKNSSSETIISEIRKLWDEYDRKISDATLIRDMLKEQYIKVLCKCYGYDTLHIFVQDYLREKTPASAKSLKRILNSKFGKHKWIIPDIHMRIADSLYGYDIPFTLNRKSYRLQIPKYSGLTENNIEYAYYGHYVLHEQESKHYLSVKYESITADDMCEYLDKLKNGEHK